MKTIPLVWLLGILCFAEGPRWQPVAVDRQGGEVYLDFESAWKAGDTVGFREFLRYKSPMTYDNLVYDEVDVDYELVCGSHRIRPTSHIVKLHGQLLHADIRSFGRRPPTSEAGVEVAYRRFCTDSMVPDP